MVEISQYLFDYLIPEKISKKLRVIIHRDIVKDGSVYFPVNWILYKHVRFQIGLN